MGKGTVITGRNYTGKMARKWGDNGWDWTEMNGGMDAIADIVSFNQCRKTPPPHTSTVLNYNFYVL